VLAELDLYSPLGRRPSQSRSATAPRRVPAEAAGQPLSIFADSRVGEFPTEYPALATLPGREPFTFRSVPWQRLSAG